jgi:regulatory protein
MKKIDSMQNSRMGYLFRMERAEPRAQNVEPRLEKVEPASEDCYQTAIKLLKYRWRTEKELEVRLVEKKFSPDEIAQVCHRLREEGLLDDRRFAENYAQSRRLRRHGHHRIARELEAKGVDRTDAAAALKGGEAEERQQLAELCKKRIGALSRLKGAEFAAAPEGRRKLTTYLLRQGYDYAAVVEVIEEQLGRNSS